MQRLFILLFVVAMVAGTTAIVFAGANDPNMCYDADWAKVHGTCNSEADWIAGWYAHPANGTTAQAAPVSRPGFDPSLPWDARCTVSYPGHLTPTQKNLYYPNCPSLSQWQSTRNT